MHLLLRLCIGSELCISAPPCVRQPSPPPCARPAHPLPPSAHQSLQKGPFAAYRHSTPAALTVTRVNDVSGLIFGECFGPLPKYCPFASTTCS